MLSGWYKMRDLRIEKNLFLRRGKGLMNFENDEEETETERQENVKGNKNLKRKRDFPLPVGANTMPCIVYIPPTSQNSHLPCPFAVLQGVLLFVWGTFSRSKSQWTNSVPAQAVLAHDRRRDALLSYAAAVGAVAAVAATSRSAAAAAVAATS
jgi:hypothetical protein